MPLGTPFPFSEISIVTDNKNFNKTVNKIVELIKKVDSRNTPDEQYPFFIELQTLCIGAFTNLEGDFVTPVIQQLEKSNLEFADLMRWTFFFECIASNAIDEKFTHSLIILPFMASSAYGLPFGEIPQEALNKIEIFLKGLFTPEYEIRINREMVNTDTFAMTPYEMQRKIKAWVAGNKPGICSFIKSEETREEMTELVADIRLIPLIVSTPIRKLPMDTHVPKPSLDKMQKNLVFALQRIFKEHYPATHLEFLMHPSAEMTKYLEKVDRSGVINTSFMLPCGGSLMEAGRLFRHFSLKEALAKLQQIDGYDIKNLQIAVAPFYEPAGLGEARMAEFRIGISLKGENSKVYQGLGWPVFFDDPENVLESLEATLRLHDFELEQVRLFTDSTFMLEDDDEEVRYPAFDGKLYEPFVKEEVSYLTPTLYQLN